MTTPPFANGRSADVCIVGGGGHVGLPLAIVLASRGLNVLIEDLNEAVLARIGRGEVPFVEHGAEPLLREALAAGRLALTASPERLGEAPAIILTLGTPVDEFLNPDYKCFRRWLDQNLARLRDRQLLILRSTVYPGTTEWVDEYFRARGRQLLLAYCPERIVQGYAVRELQQLPQIVSGTTPAAVAAASELFQHFCPSVVPLAPMEAEFAKLFANVYRYVQFAVANQFHMIASNAGVDYNRVLAGMKKDYPRLADLPKAGFAAGPCLFKDTMQLAAFAQNQFALGHAAMLVNEGLILHLVEQLRTRHRLGSMTIGLLGMAFKANNDDTRSSLSYKLKKCLSMHARQVLTTDPLVTSDPELLPLDKVIAGSDLLILCVPHDAYRGLDTQGKEVVDIWGFLAPPAAEANHASGVPE